MQDIDPRLKQIANHFGFEAQAEKTIEELAELIVAISHLHKRDGKDAEHLANFVEEVADAKIMIDQLIYLSNKGAPDDMKGEHEIEKKITKTLQRMQEESWEKDMHPDAITARNYEKNDPETLKRLGIFDKRRRNMRERKKSELNLPPPAQLMLLDKEVAAMLGIGVSTVWKKTNAADSDFPQPFYITERARRWRKSDILKWVKGLNHDKAAQPA